MGGYSFSKSVLYRITDGSDPLPATLDGENYSPQLGLVPTSHDHALFSGVEQFLVTTNGYADQDLPAGTPSNENHHPWHQGLNSAILSEGQYYIAILHLGSHS
jgi:hypothetical protein